LILKVFHEGTPFRRMSARHLSPPWMMLAFAETLVLIDVPLDITSQVIWQVIRHQREAGSPLKAG
jgi:hypothetical protein